MLSSTSVEVAWVPPAIEARNGIIHHYEIVVYEKSGTTSLLKKKINEEVSPVVVEDLHPFYQYELRMAAVTVEPGPFSDFISWTMPEDGI